MKKTVSTQQLFTRNPQADKQRSTFPRHRSTLLTFNAGDLCPVYCRSVLPNDTVKMNVASMIRYNTLKHPIHARQVADLHFWYVPNRIIWTNFVKLMGEQVDPDDSIDFLMPITSTPADGEVSLYNTPWDYMDIGPRDVNNLSVRSDPFIAYNMIYNRWYRDQNLQDSVPAPHDDGPHTLSDINVLLKRAKRKDYFTSMLPQPQKGDPVVMPLGTTAPIGHTASSGNVSVLDFNTDTWKVLNASTTNVTYDGTTSTSAQGLYADLSEATGININAFREFNMLQVFLERDARGGTRYNELNFSHFGVLSPDARVQDPEYLGSVSSQVMIDSVTSNTDTSNYKVGDLGAVGTIRLNGHAFTKSFTEHGLIIGILSVRTDQGYQQGINREWSKRTRYDFYWPAFAHLGEQAVLQKELMAVGDSTDDEVIGYAPRYSEERYDTNSVAGLYNSSHPQSLDSWHLFQEFDSPPTLNSDFIIDSPPTDRVVAVTSEPDFNGEVFFAADWTRPIPIYATPSLYDRI